MTHLKENELETFFKEKLFPIVTKYGFNFSFNDLREYKHSLTPKNAEELDDGFLDQVAGGAQYGKNYCWKLGFGMGIDTDKNSVCFVFGTN